MENAVKAFFPGCTTTDKAHLIAATGFGSGYSPFAPGTAGSAAAIVLYLLFHPLLEPSRWPLGLLFLLATTAYAVYSATVAEKYFRTKDDGRIVIDEFIGQWITLYLIPLSPAAILGAFVLFRFYDVVKPFPAGRLQGLPGGAGIVLDDLFAGIYSNLTLQLVIYGLG